MRVAPPDLGQLPSLRCGLDCIRRCTAATIDIAGVERVRDRPGRLAIEKAYCLLTGALLSGERILYGLEKR